MTNRVSAPNEANSKKEYEDLVVTAQTSQQRPSKAGTPTLEPSLLKKRQFGQFMADSTAVSNLNSSVQKSKPKLSTTTDLYDFRVTPQSEMKTNVTPSKQINEISCDITS